MDLRVGTALEIGASIRAGFPPVAVGRCRRGDDLARELAVVLGTPSCDSRAGVVGAMVIVDCGSEDGE